MAEVRIEKLNKSFNEANILHDIDLQVENGSFVVVVGPSGCGKSILLRTIAGLEELSTGAITIGGRLVNDLPPAQREIAMVFQSYALYPHMNVRQNMGFGLRFTGTPKAEVERRVQNAAHMLQIETLLNRRPKELSGGQRQRVAIGRAIVRDPKVFLFDEPLSNLDAALRVKTRLELAQLQKTLKATVIYVTHDQIEAMTLADKIVVMNKGRIEQTGQPLDLYRRPNNIFVAGFIGSPAMKFLPGVVKSCGEGKLHIVLDPRMSVTVPCKDATVKAGDRVTVGIRPEHLRIRGNGDIKLSGITRIVERLGDLGYAYIDLGPIGSLVAEVRGAETPERGETVTFATTPDHVYVFDSAGVALQAGARIA